MHSTRQVPINQTESMTLPIIAPTTGIAIQSSAPLYSQKQHDHPVEKSPTPNAQTANVHAPSLNAPTHEHHVHSDSHIHHAHKDHARHDHPDLGQEHLDHDHSRDLAHHDHSHDHTHHDHSHDHAHAHDHDPSHHAHDHSHHAHGHDHSHGHQHSYSPVFTRPLPSWVQIFSQLVPAQKTIFTWFLIHAGIGIWLYCMGTNRESLSLVGFSYLMIFDALGVLNSFISSVLRTNPAFGISNTKRPFGAHRYEIVFALGTTIYLMFATMHNTKESLEHFLLQDHHKTEVHDKEDHHLKLSFGMFLLLGSALTATCLSSITLRNHDNFVRYLRRRPTTVHGFSYNVINRARGNPFHALLSNVYSLSIVLCGSVILVAFIFGIATPFVDKLLALSESVVMFYLGYPTAKSLAKVLLQTTPNTVQNGVENRLREIQQDANIIHVDRVHFWQTTYGKCVGTIEIRIRPEADEQAVLQFVYQKLEGLTSNGSDDNESELTVSILK